MPNKVYFFQQKLKFCNIFLVLKLKLKKNEAYILQKNAVKNFNALSANDENRTYIFQGNYTSNFKSSLNYVSGNPRFDLCLFYFKDPFLPKNHYEPTQFFQI